ncbi:MAG: phosphoribosylanthranilate isomerase [Parvibaculaceae bacterium]
MSPKVKICGINSREALLAALDMRADYIGLNFYPRSPRSVSLEYAAGLADEMRGRTKIVALAVDPSDELIQGIAQEIRPDYLQAHGDESPARVREIAARLGAPVIKALKVGEPADIAAAEAYESTAAMILYDARAPEALVDALPGGNGIPFDWSFLAGKRKGEMFLLSGGLNPENLAVAVRVTGAPIVDVSSGVEIAPGVKDPGLIRKFIEAARSLG